MKAFIVQLNDEDDLDPAVVAQDILTSLTDDGFTVVAVNPWGPAPSVGHLQTPPEVQGIIPPLT